MASRFFELGEVWRRYGRLKADRYAFVRKGRRKVIFYFERFLMKDDLIECIEGWYRRDRKLIVSKMVLVKSF